MKWLALAVLVCATPASAANGVASFYGKGFHGRKTANGETFDQNAMTCAHRTLPFGTRLRVTLHGSAVCRVNDRGPFIRGRTLDVSVAVAKAIGLVSRGVSRVSVEVL